MLRRWQLGETQDVKSSSTVVVWVNDSRLGRALEAALETFLPEFTVERGSPRGAHGEIVVTTPASCSLARCRELTIAGSRVVVISPLAPITERHSYEQAGAYRYLPMVLDAISELAEAVRTAAAAYSGYLSATAVLTSRIHDWSPSDAW